MDTGSTVDSLEGDMRAMGFSVKSILKNTASTFNNSEVGSGSFNHGVSGAMHFGLVALYFHPNAFTINTKGSDNNSIPLSTKGIGVDQGVYFLNGKLLDFDDVISGRGSMNYEEFGTLLAHHGLGSTFRKIMIRQTTNGVTYFETDIYHETFHVMDGDICHNIGALFFASDLKGEKND